MTSTEEILRKIEELRNLMYLLTGEKDALTDKEIVLLSQELDKLLNEYYRLLNLKK